MASLALFFVRPRETAVIICILLANGTMARCPTSLLSRRVSDEFLDRDETSFVRIASKLSQVTVNFIVRFIYLRTSVCNRPKISWNHGHGKSQVFSLWQKFNFYIKPKTPNISITDWVTGLGEKNSYPIWLEFIIYRVSLAIAVLHLLERDNRRSVFLINLGSILLLATICTSCPNCGISQEVLLGTYMYQKNSYNTTTLEVCSRAAGTRTVIWSHTPSNVLWNRLHLVLWMLCRVALGTQLVEQRINSDRESRYRPRLSLSDLVAQSAG